MTRAPRQSKRAGRAGPEAPRAPLGFDPTKTGNVMRRTASIGTSTGKDEPRPGEPPAAPVQAIQLRIDPLAVFLLGEAAEREESKQETHEEDP